VRKKQDYVARYKRQKELWDHILVRFDKEDGEAIRAQAARDHASMAETIRFLISMGLETLEQS